MNTAQDTRKSDIPTICQFVQDTRSRLGTAQDIPEGFDALMQEFTEKAKEVHSCYEEGKTQDLDKKIIELEQAADSVLSFANAHGNINDNLRVQIQECHDNVRDLKASQVKH